MTQNDRKMICFDGEEWEIGKAVKKAKQTVYVFISFKTQTPTCKQGQREQKHNTNFTQGFFLLLTKYSTLISDNLSIIYFIFLNIYKKSTKCSMISAL